MWLKTLPTKAAKGFKKLILYKTMGPNEAHCFIFIYCIPTGGDAPFLGNQAGVDCM